MYTQQEAFDFIMNDMKDNSALNYDESTLKNIISISLKADIDYMIQSGLLKRENEKLQILKEGFYDDDQAFEFILKKLKNSNLNISSSELTSFVDEYMDAQENFLEEKNLLGWDE